MKNFKFNKRMLGKVLTVTLVLFAVSPLLAGGSGAAISSAADTISGYKDSVKKLVYAIAGVVGFIGAVRIYNKWQNGDQDINKEIMGWAGAFVFLVVAPTFIDAFFR